MIGKHEIDLARNSTGEFTKDGITWKVIDIAPRYWVSDHGDIISTVRKGRIMKKTIGTHGYPYVSIMIDDKPIKMLVHRIMGKAFLDGEKETINHIDGNKENNHISNLEWATHKENLNHAFSTGLNNCYGEGHPHSKITKEQALEIQKRGQSGENHVDIARDYPISRQHVQKIISGYYWSRANGIT